MDEQRVVYPATEHYLAMKRDDAVTHGATYVHLENIVLHKRNKKLKVTLYDFNSMKCPEHSNPLEQNS